MLHNQIILSQSGYHKEFQLRLIFLGEPLSFPRYNVTQQTLIRTASASSTVERRQKKSRR